jgi:hypothetical protein
MASEPRFFVLKEEYGGPHDTAGLPADGIEPGTTFRTGDAARCPKCGEAIGMREWLPPYRVEITVHGKEGAGDLVEFTGDDLLISQRVAEVIRSEALTGLHDLRPVEVVRMNARARRLGLPKYVLAKVAFGRAALDEARSRLRRAKPLTCEECREPGIDAIYGFRIQPGTWEGLDAFLPRGLQSEVVVSERFADFVQRHGFTNIKLVPTEQFVWDPYRKGPPAETAQA